MSRVLEPVEKQPINMIDVVTSWPFKTLDELGYVSRGRSRHRPRNAAHLYGGPYPFIQTGDVKHANLYITEYSQTYSDAGLEQSRLWKAGTLCITIAANIADTAILGIDACFPDSVIGFIPDDNQADARFIKYLFDSYLQSKFKRVSQGVAQDNLSQEKLLSIQFPVPPLPTQQKIASILSAYDDLIENNRRRIVLLEQAARLLYQEWFVHFRFPCHEHVCIVDGLPEGWEKVKLEAITALINRGITPKYDDEGESLVINQKCIRNKQLDLAQARRQNKEFKADKQIQYGDILINSTGTGTLGRVAQVIVDIPKCTFDSHITVVRPQADIEALWFGFTLMSFESVFQAMGEGSTNQTELNKSKLFDLKICLPAKSLRVEFNEIVKASVDQITNLKSQNIQLQKARDILLPQLMNGELGV